MNWKKAIIYGIGFWIVMFALVSTLIAWHLYGSVSSRVLTAFSGYAVAVILASRAGVKNYQTAIGYGFVWAVIGLLLDVFVTLRFNPQIFSSWPLWLGYALVILAPLVCVEKPYRDRDPNRIRIFEA